MTGAEPARQVADQLVVGAALPVAVEDARPDRDVSLAEGPVDVVVLEEHRRGQYDIGVLRGGGHELLVHAEEQVVARQAPLHRVAVRGDVRRVGVLNQHRRDRGTVLQRVGIATQDRTDPGLVKHARYWIDHVEPVRQRQVEIPDTSAWCCRTAARSRRSPGPTGR